MSSQARKARVVLHHRITILFVVFLGLCLSSLLLPKGVFTQAETCVQPPPGVVAWWPLDETSGTTAEDVIGGRNGVHINGPVPTPGKVGGALRFNGTNSYVGAPDSDLWAFGTGNFTVEFWANFDAPSSGDIVHPGDVFISSDDGPGTQNKWIFALGGGLLELIVVNTADLPPDFFLVRAPFSPVVGEWYHLAVTKTATLFTIYVNGVEVGSEVSTPPISNANAPLIIGQSNEPFGGFMNGLLDEVTIYNRALTQGELQAIVAAGSAGKCKALSITTKSLSAVRLGDFFSQQLETRFGQPPFTWSILGGSLPAGVNLSSEGLLSGTPNEAGSFTFTVRVADSNNHISEKDLTLDVLLTLPPSDIRFSKTGNVTVPGRTVDYFILVENIGSVTAQDIQVTELLFPHSLFEFISADPDPQIVTETGIFWRLSRLDPGQSQILRYSVRLNPTIPLGESIPGTLDVRVSNEDQEASKEWVNNLENLPCKANTPECQTLLFICAQFGCHPLSHLSVCASCPDTWLECTKNCDSCELFPDTWFVKCDKANLPIDPNEKEVIAKKFIQPDQLLVYPIHFENIGTIEARDVFVTDALNPKLDASTLNLLTPTGGSFDVATRIVRWDLLNTNLEPGETGNVLLSVRPRPGLPSGTVLRNSATIQFEVFQPIVTNEVVNIIDSTRPTSAVNPLPAETSTLDFPISWSGSDAIGKIDFYSILVSVDGGNFTPFLERTRDTSATFSGEAGKTYSFLSIATDTAGNIEVQSATAEASTRVVANCATGGDNEPPTIVAPPAVTLYTGADATSCGVTVKDLDATLGVASASDNCPGVTVTRSGVPECDLFPVGQTTVTYTATDAIGNTAMATPVVTVIDNTPPTIAAESVSPASLWPPEHKMRDVTVNYNAADNCGPPTCTLSVTSNEPINGTGDGDSEPDWEVVDAHYVRLRSERAGTGGGRTYTITITCRDSAGNSSSRSLTVRVPRNQR